MDKREIIERALDKIFWDSPRISVNAGRAATQILADQAIAMPVLIANKATGRRDKVFRNPILHGA